MTIIAILLGATFAGWKALRGLVLLVPLLGGGAYAVALVSLDAIIRYEDPLPFLVLATEVALAWRVLRRHATPW